MRRALFFILIVATASPVISAESPHRVALKPCHIRNVKQELQCGTVEVFEDRDKGEGRRVPLHIVVLPATGKRVPDPVFWFSGGPGEAATNEVELTLRVWKDINIRRDIVLVDIRGTGESNGLACLEKNRQSSVQARLESFYSAKDLSACRKELELRADLRLYNTSLAVDDLEDVRAALGYDKINIAGGSYGTRVVLVYLRRHPEHVRTATLWGVVPVNARMPVSMAADAQASLDGLIAACAGERECGADFPDTAKDLAKILAETSAKAVEVSAEDPVTHRRQSFALSHSGLIQTVRFMLYSPETAAWIPLQVHQAARGNWMPIAQSAYTFADKLATTLSDGYYLSTTCSEDVPFYTEKEAEAAARGTFFGNYRATVQKEACAQWPCTAVDRSFLDPVRSDIPALLIEGSLDPVTPPRFAEYVAETLSHSRVVVVRRGSHDFEGMKDSSCIDRIIGQFFDKSDEATLDTSCVDDMQPAPFARNTIGIEPK